MAKSRARVAVVDDDASVRRALGRLLDTAGFEVAVYSSGVEFIAALDTFSPRLVVLDLHMPGLTGLDVQDHLRRTEPDIPVMVITGHENAQAQARAIAMGAIAYFAKPIKAEELIAAILKATANRSGHSSAPI